MSRKEEIKKIKQLKKQADKDYKAVMNELQPGRKKYWVSAVLAAGIIGYNSLTDYHSQEQFTAQEHQTIVEQNYQKTAQQSLDTQITQSKVEEPPKPTLDKKDTVFDNQNIKDPFTTNIEIPAKEYSSDEIKIQVESERPLKGYFYFPIRNDTLYSIARNVTGKSSNWPEIQKYNNIPNHIIEVNEPIAIPVSLIKNESLVYSGTLPEKVVQAKKHDNLELIARRELGSMDYAKTIYCFNKYLNPRFSAKIYHKEYVFIPPKH